MKSSKIDEFKKELKALLKKYNANIYFWCDESSDLLGINDEQMKVTIDGKHYLLADGYEIDVYEL